jgi:hypothetical protein
VKKYSAAFAAFAAFLPSRRGNFFFQIFTKKRILQRLGKNVDNAANAAEPKNGSTTMVHKCQKSLPHYFSEK